MNFGSDARPVGRFVVDIDGSLRATDTARVSPADIIALHGRARFGSVLVWERNGEAIPLASDDRIELDESMVFFFRTAPKRHLHQQMACELRPGHRLHDVGERAWHVAA